MRTFGFSIAITLFLAFASCDVRADNKTATVSSVRPDARTKQTFDKKTSTSMPVETAQRLRGDQLELNLIQEQLRSHTDPLVQRINAVLAEYGTQIQDIEFDTGAIHRAPKPPTSPAQPSRTPPTTPAAGKK